MSARRAEPSDRFDAVVVGDGLIGLACAVALADRGARVGLLGAREPGQASWAAAGMLAPGVERGEGAAHDFAVAGRDRWPGFAAMLHARTGVEVGLDRSGVLQVALDAEDAARLRLLAGGAARWLEPAELAALEPALDHALGALLHADDGFVDNRRALEALEAIATAEPRVRRLAGPARGLEAGGEEATVRTATGDLVAAGRVVLAAGAWSALLDGLPRRLPVEPVRGQMLAVGATPLRHVVYGPGGYLVPRPDRTLVGATMEHVGFDAGTSDEALGGIRASGERICPALVGAAEVARWAGLRPITPDGQPILGADPELPALLYATGHSRNGVLLAPITAETIAALVAGEAPPASLEPFAADRFTRAADRATE